MSDLWGEIGLKIKRRGALREEWTNDNSYIAFSALQTFQYTAIRTVAHNIGDDTATISL